MLADETTGFEQDFVVNVSQVLVISKTRLIERRGQLDRLALELSDMDLQKVSGLL